MNISSKIARRYVRIGILGFIILLLTACGTGGSANPTATSNTTPAITGTITEFPTGSNPEGITAGPDGNLWFTEGNNIGRMTPTGAITEFPNGAGAITAGPDGNLWFTEVYSNKIGKITPPAVSPSFPYPRIVTTPTILPLGQMATSGLPTPWGTRSDA